MPISAARSYPVRDPTSACVHLKDSTVLVASIGNVIVVINKIAPTAQGLDVMNSIAQSPSFREASTKGCGILIISRSPESPSDPVFAKKASASLQGLGCAAFAAAIPCDSIVQKLSRVVMQVVLTMVNGDFPKKIFAESNRAVVWLADTLEARGKLSIPRESLELEVDELIRQAG
jgi:hypothetical protein